MFIERGWAAPTTTVRPADETETDSLDPCRAIEEWYAPSRTLRRILDRRESLLALIVKQDGEKREGLRVHAISRSAASTRMTAPEPSTTIATKSPISV